MATKRNIKVERVYDEGTREPRKGELNFELKQVMLRHCTQKPLKDAVKSVQIAVSRLAKRYGIKEFTVDCQRSTDTRGNTKPWICEGINVPIYRRRHNGTLAIHRAGASSYPHFFQKGAKSYANLSAARDMTVFYCIDDPYDWRHHACRKPRKGLLASWKRHGRKNVHADA